VSKGDAHCLIVMVLLWQNQDVQMSVRHSVENLCRRGNIFYWRPRVPTFFTQIADGSRLSLSLRCSDHRKAQIFARHLNTKLAGFRCRKEACMTTKQRLNAFFVNERDRLEVQYDIQAATERLISDEDETLSIETDFVCGHVHRLLEKFGTRRPLSFEKDCPSLVYLQKQGVHKRYYDDIKRSYFIELEVSQHETFSARLRRKMARHKIIDTLGTAELAKQYYFRACSDANLDIEERYPALDQSFLYQKANDNNVEQGAAYDCGAVTDGKAEAINIHTSAESAVEGKMLSQAWPKIVIEIRKSNELRRP
jgi:hypothetical protein